MHVLIVGSDSDLGEDIARKLRKLGHTSVIARDVAEGLAEAAPLRTPPTTSIDIAIVSADLPNCGAAKLMALLGELGIRGVAVVRGKANWLAMKAAGFSFSLPAPVTQKDLRALFIPLEGRPPEQPKRAPHPAGRTTSADRRAPRRPTRRS